MPKNCHRLKRTHIVIRQNLLSQRTVSFIPCHMCRKCPSKWFPGNGQRQHNHSLHLTDTPPCQWNTENKKHLFIDLLHQFNDLLTDLRLQGGYTLYISIWTHSGCKSPHNTVNKPCTVWKEQLRLSYFSAAHSYIQYRSPCYIHTSSVGHLIQAIHS